jgi:hypothetical protein
MNLCEFVICFRDISGKAEMHRKSTPVELGSPHEATFAGFVDIYVYQLSIPTDL